MESDGELSGPVGDRGRRRPTDTGLQGVGASRHGPACSTRLGSSGAGCDRRTWTIPRNESAHEMDRSTTTPVLRPRISSSGDRDKSIAGNAGSVCEAVLEWINCALRLAWFDRRRWRDRNLETPYRERAARHVLASPRARMRSGCASADRAVRSTVLPTLATRTSIRRRLPDRSRESNPKRWSCCVVLMPPNAAIRRRSPLSREDGDSTGEATAASVGLSPPHGTRVTLRHPLVLSTAQRIASSRSASAN